MALSPFDFLNSINTSKKDLLAEDPLAVKDYSAFMINRGLSYFPDTVLYANAMNQNAGAPNDWQYYFFLNSLTKKKRFSKWHKKDAETESFRLVKEYYGYTDKRAMEALSILSADQLAMIKEKLYKGGK